MRILGLDYGTKTVGVALSDPLGITAQGVETIFRKEENKLRQTYARIEAIMEENGVGLVVVGLPKNMNNSEGEMAVRAKEFAANLERRSGVRVILADERLTTVMADKVLEGYSVKKQDRKQYIDKIAATYILQTYLDYVRMNGQNVEDMHGDD